MKRYTVFYAGGEKDGQTIFTTDKLPEAINAALEAPRDGDEDHGVEIYDEEKKTFVEY